MPPVDILSAFIKADYQRSLLLFTCLTLDLHATDAEPQLALLAAFYSVLDFRSSGRVFRKDFRTSGKVFRKHFRSSGRVFRRHLRAFRKGLPEALPGLPEGSSGSSGRVFRKHFRVFRKGLPEESSGVFQQFSEVFRKGLPGLPEVSSGGRLRRSPIFLPLENRAKTWCNRQINSFQI